MKQPIIIFMESYDRKEYATRAMHGYARNLRRLRKTARYGVTVKPRAGSWWLCLVDRQGAKTP